MDELKSIADKRKVIVDKLSTTRPQRFVAPPPLKPNPEYQLAINELGSNQLFVSNLAFSLQGKMSDIALALQDLNSGSRYVLVTRLVVPKAQGLGPAVVTADFTGQIFTLSAQ